MNKKMRELMTKIQAKAAEAKSFMEGENKDIAKANALLDEYESLKAEFEAEKRLFEIDKELNTPSDEVLDAKKEEKEEKDSFKEFAKAARMGFYVSPEDKAKTLNEGTNSDGGYTVPQDIQTRINKYRDAEFSLLSLVRTEKVSTKSGSRIFQVKTAQTGFSSVNENSAIGVKSTPQFEKIDYSIKKYAGIFPVTNELLADSDANIANTLIEWIGGESRATANSLILARLKAKAETDLSNLDGIKKALNVTLGQAYKATSKIITNDDGLNYLDTLKDENGRYLLNPDPTDSAKLSLRVGAIVVPIIVIPNAVLVSTPVYKESTDTTVTTGKTYYTRSGSGTDASPYVYTEVESPTGNPSTSSYYEFSSSKVPVIVGDLNEAIQYFDRQQTTIKVSDSAVVAAGASGEINAFEDDVTLYRAIEREDVVTRDINAYVNGYISLT